MSSDIQPWFAVYFFDIGHPCYDQLTPVKSEYPLTSITLPYHGLKFRSHRGHMFFRSLPLTTCWFSDWIAGSCQVNNNNNTVLKNAKSQCFYIRFKIITRIRSKFYYRLKAILKRCVLSLVLKESKVSECLIKSGSLFQSLGDTHAKDLSP